MAIDWQAIADAGGIGKGKPARLEKMERDRERATEDERENKKVKARSLGQCEVRWFGRYERVVRRCKHKAMPGVHHMIFGRGKRARGKSLLARHKQDVCHECHTLIHGHILRRVGGDLPLHTDEYERVDR